MEISQSILEQLYSSKLKDKNNAIEHLERLLDSESFKPPSSLKSLLKALILSIEDEQTLMNEAKVASTRTKHQHMLISLATCLKKSILLGIQWRNVSDCFLDLVKHMLSVLPLYDGLFKPLASIYGNLLRHLMSMGEYHSLLPTSYFHHIFKLCKLSLIGGHAEQENTSLEVVGISQENVDFARILFLLIVHYPRDLSCNSSAMALDTLQVLEYMFKRNSRSLQLDDILISLSNYILLEWSCNDCLRSLHFCSLVFTSIHKGTVDMNKMLFYRIYCELLMTLNSISLDDSFQSYSVSVKLHLQQMMNGITPLKLNGFDFSLASTYHLESMYSLDSEINECKRNSSKSMNVKGIQALSLAFILLWMYTPQTCLYDSCIPPTLHPSILYTCCITFKKYLKREFKIKLIEWLSAYIDVQENQDWIYPCISLLLSSDISREHFELFRVRVKSGQSIHNSILFTSRWIQVYDEWNELPYLYSLLESVLESKEALNLILYCLSDLLSTLNRKELLLEYLNTFINKKWISFIFENLNWKTFPGISSFFFAFYGISMLEETSIDLEEVDRPRWSFVDYEEYSFDLFVRNCQLTFKNSKHVSCLYGHVQSTVNVYKEMFHKEMLQLEKLILEILEKLEKLEILKATPRYLILVLFHQFSFHKKQEFHQLLRNSEYNLEKIPRNVLILMRKLQEKFEIDFSFCDLDLELLFPFTCEQSPMNSPLDSIKLEKENQLKRKRSGQKSTFFSKYISREDGLDSIQSNSLHSLQNVVDLSLLSMSRMDSTLKVQQVKVKKHGKIFFWIIQQLQSIDSSKPNDFLVFLYQEFSLWISCIELNQEEISTILVLLYNHLQISWISLNEWMILYFLRILQGLYLVLDTMELEIKEKIYILLQAFYIRIHGKNTLSHTDFKMRWRCCLEWDFIYMNCKMSDLLQLDIHKPDLNSMAFHYDFHARMVFINRNLPHILVNPKACEELISNSLVFLDSILNTNEGEEIGSSIGQSITQLLLWTRIASSCPTHLIDSILVLLLYICKTKILKSFIHSCFQVISINYGFSNSNSFLKEILHFKLIQRWPMDILSFPYEPFGYPNRESFYSDYLVVIIPHLFSCQKYKKIQELCRLCRFDVFSVVQKYFIDIMTCLLPCNSISSIQELPFVSELSVLNEIKRGSCSIFLKLLYNLNGLQGLMMNDLTDSPFPLLPLPFDDASDKLYHNSPMVDHKPNPNENEKGFAKEYIQWKEFQVAYQALLSICESFSLDSIQNILQYFMQELQAQDHFEYEQDRLLMNGFRALILVQIDSIFHPLLFHMVVNTLVRYTTPQRSSILLSHLFKLNIFILARAQQVQFIPTTHDILAILYSFGLCFEAHSTLAQQHVKELLQILSAQSNLLYFKFYLKLKFPFLLNDFDLEKDLKENDLEFILLHDLNHPFLNSCFTLKERDFQVFIVAIQFGLKKNCLFIKENVGNLIQKLMNLMKFGLYMEEIGLLLVDLNQLVGYPSIKEDLSIEDLSSFMSNPSCMTRNMTTIGLDKTGVELKDQGHLITFQILIHQLKSNHIEISSLSSRILSRLLSRMDYLNWAKSSLSKEEFNWIDLFAKRYSKPMNPIPTNGSWPCLTIESTWTDLQSFLSFPMTDVVPMKTSINDKDRDLLLKKEKEWISHFLLSILTTFPLDFYSHLCPMIELDSSIAPLLFNYIIKSILELEKESNPKMEFKSRLSCFMNWIFSTFSTISCSTPTEKKQAQSYEFIVKTFINLIEFLKCQSTSSNSSSNSRDMDSYFMWLDLDYIKAAEAALYIQEYKHSLMYLELGLTCFDLSNDSPTKVNLGLNQGNLELLIQIYKGLNNVNGLQGVLKLLDSRFYSDLLLKNKFKNVKSWERLISFSSLSFSTLGFSNTMERDSMERNTTERNTTLDIIKCLENTGNYTILSKFILGCDSDLLSHPIARESYYESCWRSGSLAKEFKDELDPLQMNVKKSSFSSFLYHSLSFLQCKNLKKSQEYCHLGLVKALSDSFSLEKCIMYSQVLNVIEFYKGNYTIMDLINKFRAITCRNESILSCRIRLLEMLSSSNLRLTELQEVEFKNLLNQDLLTLSKVYRKSNHVLGSYETLEFYKNWNSRNIHSHPRNTNDESLAFGFHDPLALLERCKLLNLQNESALAISCLKSCLNVISCPSKRRELYGLLGYWCGIARLDNPKDIIGYFELAFEATNITSGSTSDTISGSTLSRTILPMNFKTTSKIHYRLAQYADQQYTESIQEYESKREIELDFKQHKQNQLKEYQDYLTTLKAKPSTKNVKEIQKIQHILSRLKLEIEIDSNESLLGLENRLLLLEKSILNYCRCLVYSENSKWDMSVFRFTSLWLSHSMNSRVNKIVNKEIVEIPSFKFLNLVYQLSARLSASTTSPLNVSPLNVSPLNVSPLNVSPLNVSTSTSTTSTTSRQEESKFLDILFKLISRMTLDHPFHCIYQLLALNNTHKTTTKIQVLLNTLKSQKEIYSKIQQLCCGYISLSADPIPESKAKKYPIRNGNILTRVRSLQGIPPLSLPIPVNTSCDYTHVPYILKYDSYYWLPGGINAPKVITCKASDGILYSELVKGKDDTRQDAVLSNVYQMLDFLLKKNIKTRDLRIKTYLVIPLNPQAGVVQWVPNTTPLGSLFYSLHAKYHPNEWKPNVAREKMSIEHGKSGSSLDSKLKVYKEITTHLTPAFRCMFFEKYKDPCGWFVKRQSYTKSVAASSIAGYITGLGDRHINNILLDSETAQVIHIDLGISNSIILYKMLILTLKGIAFDQGKLLSTPELVPFRLTRDIVDGMGLTGVEGDFRSGCEETLRLLKQEKYVISTILDVFKYDPLYRWSVCSLINPKKKRDPDPKKKDDEFDNLNENLGNNLGENKEAARALLGVEKKLSMNTSVECQVNELIYMAQDERNLCRIYPGWQPWF